MGSLRLWIFLSILFSVVTWYFVIPKIHEKPVTIGKFTIPLLFILAFVLRIVLSTSYVGFGADFACFSAWADRMADLGPSRFYAKDYFDPLDGPTSELYMTENTIGIHLKRHSWSDPKTRLKSRIRIAFGDAVIAKIKKLFS